MARIINVNLLGDFAIFGPSRLRFPTRKTGLLFAFLAIQPGYIASREKLKSIFWDDRSEQQASGSLRRSLSDIRRIIGDDEFDSILIASKAEVLLSPERCVVDVVEFEKLAASSDENELARAASLYKGDLLPTVTPPDATSEAWLRVESQRLRNTATSLAERLADVAEAKANLEAATNLAGRLLNSDPTLEEAYRTLILCDLKSGRENSAKRHYAKCVEALKAHLGVEPEERTKEILNWRSSRPVPVEGDKPSTSDADVIPAVAEVRRLSIAVMPFEYLGPDPDQQHFADGITDEILTELSRIRDFVVISRQSSSALSDLQPTEIRETLGVNYLVSGNLRRSGDYIRVSSQLIDTLSGAQIWAGRFERTMGDFFTLQDEITQNVVQSIYPEITSNETVLALRAPVENLTAWEKFHRGMWHIHRGTSEDYDTASDLFAAAIEENSNYASPHAGLACVKLIRATTHNGEDFDALTDAALEFGEAALTADPTDSYSLTIHASTLSLKGKLDDARICVEEALRHNPNFLMALYCQAQLLLRSGNYSVAQNAIDAAILRSPRDPQMGSFLMLKACCEYGLENYEQMFETTRAAIRVRAPDSWSYLLAAVAALNVGKDDQAREFSDKLKTNFPNVSATSARFLTENTTNKFSDKLRSDLVRLDI